MKKSKMEAVSTVQALESQTPLIYQMLNVALATLIKLGFAKNVSQRTICPHQMEMPV